MLHMKILPLIFRRPIVPQVDHAARVGVPAAGFAVLDLSRRGKIAHGTAGPVNVVRSSPSDRTGGD